MPPLIFALVGKTGHGKSMTANSLSASDHFLADDGFESVTRDISSLLYTVESGQQFLCLDMPDVCDTRLALPERDTRMSKLALKAPYGLDALAFIIRKVRMTEEEFTSISQMEALFGSDVWKHAIFVFTHCAATSAKLEADLAKLGEEHILNKAIQKANGRVAKIDNNPRNQHQFKHDVECIHSLLVQVSKDTGTTYDNAAFERAREAVWEVLKDENIHKAVHKYQHEPTDLRRRFMQGQLSQEDSDTKVKETAQKRHEMEVQHARESFENWGDAVKQYACYAGLAGFGLGCAVVASPYLVPFAGMAAVGYANMAWRSRRHKLQRLRRSTQGMKQIDSGKSDFGMSNFITEAEGRQATSGSVLKAKS